MDAAAAACEPVAQVQCPLCGGRFPGQEACPSGCPLAGGCKTYCCPNCHYRFTDRSAVADLVRRLLKKTRKH